MMINGLQVNRIVIDGDVAHVEFAYPAHLMMDGECQMPLLVKTIDVALIPTIGATEIEIDHEPSGAE